MRKDEEAIKDNLLGSLQDFIADAFDPGNPTPRLLQTNTCAHPEFVKDLNTALVDGLTQIEVLLQERVNKIVKDVSSNHKEKQEKEFQQLSAVVVVKNTSDAGADQKDGIACSFEHCGGVRHDTTRSGFGKQSNKGVPVYN